MKQNKLIGVDGWLLYITISLWLAPIIFVSQLLRSSSITPSSVAITCSLSIIAVTIGILLFIGKYYARYMATIFFMLVFGLTVYRVEDPDLFVIAPPLIWAIYFMVSRRVRNTYKKGVILPKFDVQSFYLCGIVALVQILATVFL